MAGMCRETGRRLSGWDHIRQSLDVIFTTRVGTRVERRSFGSVAPELQDKPATDDTILDHYVAIAEAIDQFEPRVELQGFELVQANADGDAAIDVILVETSTGLTQRMEVSV